MAGAIVNLIRPKKLSPMTQKELLEKVSAFRISRIILTAMELNVFTAIGDKCLDSGEIARRIGADPRALDRLLRSLCALKLLKFGGNRFANASFSRKYLVKGKPGFLKSLFHNARIYENWNRLTQTVRMGKPPGKPRKSGENDEWLEGFIAAMHERAMPQATRILGLLDLRAMDRLLDIGAGSGAYTIAFLRKRRKAHATVFDRPEVIRLTRRYLQDARLDRRVEFQSGDFTRDVLGSGYDLVLLSAIIHMQSLDKNRKLFGRIGKALRPGGMLVIQDFIMDRARLKPTAGVLFALNMLVNTQDGDTYTAEEIAETLTRSGFSDIQVIKTLFPASLVTARKLTNR